MSLIVYSLEQAEQWDNVVRSFKDYDIYWLAGYVKAFQIHGDGEPLLFYYEDPDTRGINVVMKRDIANDKYFIGRLDHGLYFDFTSPYGYGGWLIEGDNVETLFLNYLEWVTKHNIVCEFVRFHPIVRNHEKCAKFYNIKQLGEVVHIDLDSPETIWSNITSKNRNMIRKSTKNNIKIYNGRFPEIYESFRLIYNSTMDKDNADKYYYFQQPFYNSILEDLPSNSQVFWAEKDNIVIAASIMLMANGRMNYHLSGSLKEFSSLAPTNLLLYRAALWGNANGFKTLYLGGGVGSAEDNLFKFKRSFYKGELNHFNIGWRTFNQESYDRLVKMKGQVERDYFPKYRA